ncbi:MAG: hypothetical protein LBB36_02535 [Fibromonadaceae bacterium]|jgi:hypothetical protein|nr:hypothetical protein [Fibromonadaceae bacterium]
MKKILFGILFFSSFASGALNESFLMGNWTLEKLPVATSSIYSVESGFLKIEKDWKFAETGIYNINYPSYGKDKVDLKYKLKLNVSGEYRIEGKRRDEFKKYYTNFEIEIIEGSESNAEAAQSSLKEIERLFKTEIVIPIRVLSISETEMEMLGVNNNPNRMYTKPKKLPNSKLTLKQVPFFAPEGWRYPETTKELDSYPTRLKTKDITLLTIVEADFNGDGLQDAIAYLINDQTGQIALFLNLSQPDGSYSLEPYGSADRNTIIENGVFPAPAGEYTNVSTKQKFTTERDGFMIIIFDTAANLVYWDNNNWVTVPIGKKF